MGMDPRPPISRSSSHARLLVSSFAILLYSGGRSSSNWKNTFRKPGARRYENAPVTFTMPPYLLRRLPQLRCALEPVASANHLPWRQALADLQNHERSRSRPVDGPQSTRLLHGHELPDVRLDATRHDTREERVLVRHPEDHGVTGYA